MKTMLTLIIALFSTTCFGQDGLEGVIVEKYYITSDEDTTGSLKTGIKESGLVTYRIFVDLKPGFTFQAAFGSPEHPLVIKSSEPFYNHPGGGTHYANILPERAMKNESALLDSWISVGAAGENHLGILKRYDDATKDSLLNLEKSVLKLTSKDAGIALAKRDGLVRVYDMPFPTLYRLEESLIHLGTEATGTEVRVENGAWACMGKGAKGADSLTTNCVLIAQLTTKGSLDFELNLLIGAPNGTSQKYVARNPGLDEWIHEDLSFSTADKNDKRNRGKLNKRGTRK